MGFGMLPFQRVVDREWHDATVNRFAMGGEHEQVGVTSAGWSACTCSCSLSGVILELSRQFILP